MIAARALKICLIVLKNIQSVYNIHVIEHHSDEDKVFVVKTGDHYDAVVLINDKPLGVENNVERLVVTDIMLRNTDNDIVNHKGHGSTDAANPPGGIETVSPEGTFCDTVQVPSNVVTWN